MVENEINIKLQNSIIHRVANQNIGGELRLSDKELDLTNNELVSIITQYCLSSFKNTPEQNFIHSSNLNLNEVYFFSNEIFKDSSKFIENSKKIAKHLYSCSKNVNIKDGEVLVALFNNYILEDGEICNALAIMKIESHNYFLETNFKNGYTTASSRVGVNINKIDKGCLILSTNQDEGNIVYAIDNTNRGSEAQFWFKEFLDITLINNNYLQTKNILLSSKQFFEDNENILSLNKTQEIDLFSRSLDFFSLNDNFNSSKFEKEVLKDDKIIEAFNSFKGNFEKINNLELNENFEISKLAWKQEKRKFKNLLNLDNNIQIQIKKDTSKIIQGSEGDLKFYKIYYDNEY